jgi:hypothetical protein
MTKANAHASKGEKSKKTQNSSEASIVATAVAATILLVESNENTIPWYKRNAPEDIPDMTAEVSQNTVPALPSRPESGMNAVETLMLRANMRGIARCLRIHAVRLGKKLANRRVPTTMIIESK